MKTKKVKYKPGKILAGFGLRIMLYLYAACSLYPVIWMVFYSLKNNDEIFVTNPFGFPAGLRIENYQNALTAYNVPIYFKNSVIVTVIAVFFSTLFALLFAYGVSRFRFKIRKGMRIFLMLGMFIPVQVLMIPLAVLVRDLGIANTRLAVIIPYIAFNVSFAAMVFTGFFNNIPIEMEEAACMDGASIYRCFSAIMMPMVKPAIATVIIFNFLSIWNEFSIALILLSKESLKTLPLGLMFFQGTFTTDWGAMGAAMVVASLPTVVIYILFSEQVEKAMTVGAAIK